MCIYQCIKLLQHIPRHIYQFGRYLRIRYDSQPINNPTISGNNNPNTEDTVTPINHDTPTIRDNEEKTLPRNITIIQRETPKPQKTIKNPKNPKQGINLPPKTRHQHLIRLLQNQQLQHQSIFKNPHKTPIE